ncbi:hypothetical protein TEA_023267 [Camellia sinensis var. sinensis]|uniref:EGF-like domain-containing protein n=1 Tax=Camellia sinensis var. sinensis TaxID=542762 RepID=A0A4S4DJS7_CAMSN|nr:hypothetical protein TEA_023267 [Camellia sinensis var. sinensis]
MVATVNAGIWLPKGFQGFESGILLQPMLAWVLGSVVLAATVASAADETSYGCPSTCDEIIVPYPFGTKEGCYMEEHFHVTCDHSTDPQKLYLNASDASIEITKILLSVRSSKFPISITRNKFIAIGCDTYDVIEGFEGRNYSTGCLSQCDNSDNVTNGSCSGIGCCEKSIPKRVTSFKFNAIIEFDINDQTWRFSILDIDECLISSPSPCNITCHNLLGTYSCSCPEGYEGDGRIDGSGCSPIPHSNNIPSLIKIALDSPNKWFQSLVSHFSKKQSAISKSAQKSSCSKFTFEHNNSVVSSREVQNCKAQS